MSSMHAKKIALQESVRQDSSDIEMHSFVLLSSYGFQFFGSCSFCCAMPLLCGNHAPSARNKENLVVHYSSIKTLGTDV